MKKSRLIIFSLVLLLICSLGFGLTACGNDGDSTNNITYTEVAKVEPTCEKDGMQSYYVGSDEKNYIKNSEGNYEEVDIATLKINALGHDWNDVIYTWSDDLTKCIALRKCKKDSQHVETAVTENIAIEVTAPKCEVKGNNHYTATFTEEWAGTISKDVSVDALGHDFSKINYIWAKDNSTCQATSYCSREGCVKNLTEIVIPKVEEKDGQRIYTAVFSHKELGEATKISCLTKHTYERENVIVLWGSHAGNIDPNAAAKCSYCEKKEPGYFGTFVKSEDNKKIYDFSGAGEFPFKQLTFLNPVKVNTEVKLNDIANIVKKAEGIDEEKLKVEFLNAENEVIVTPTVAGEYKVHVLYEGDGKFFYVDDTHTITIK